MTVTMCYCQECGDPLKRKQQQRDELLAALKDARAQIIALCSEGDVPDSVNEAIRKTEEADREA